MHKLPQPRRRRDQYGDLWIDGEFFMGRQRVPPMPNRTALTDRVTGAIKALSHTGASPELVDPRPQWSDITLYGPYFGPISNNWRLFLSNGTLGFEAVTGMVSYSGSRILTRKNFETTVLELTVDPLTGNVVYTQVTL